MPTIRTLVAPCRFEIPKIRGSRFLGVTAPAISQDAARAVVETEREVSPEATHHCFAWRLGGEPATERSSDDGEPSGTAGRPILREIAGRDLSDVAVVVVRWYGGTKLGTGGLVRAYSAAAAAVLEEAEILEVRQTEVLELRYSYDLSGPVQGVLSAVGATVGESAYAADVRQSVAVPVEDVEHAKHELVEATAGRIEICEACSRRG